MKKWHVLLALATLAPLMAELPDLSWEHPGWKFGTGAKVQNGVLTLQGDGSGTQSAQIRLASSDIGSDDFFIHGEIRTEDFVPGPKPFTTAKFKIIHGDDPKNSRAGLLLGTGTGGIWVSHQLHYLEFPGKKPAEFILEISLQQSKGIFQVRNLKISTSKPAEDLSFPWAIPADPVCRLDLKSTEAKPFNSRLLGMNSHFVSTASLSYQRKEIVDLIDSLKIPVLRFPGGTVANWYDYETDGFQIPPKGAPFVEFAIPTKKFDFKGYLKLMNRHQLTSIQVFNVIQDSPERSAARLKFLKETGLNIPWIELGNENHDKGQQGGPIRSVAGYIETTKAVTAALKSVDPKVKVAVNINLADDQDWGIPISKESYYDAVVMHPYIFLGTDPKLTWNGSLIRAMFSAYALENKLLGRYREIFGSRPLLLSEWGIIAPMDTLFSQAATLGTADQFISILDHAEDGLVEMASIHIFFGRYMGLYDVDAKDRAFKNSYGILFELIYEAFRDRILFAGRSQSTDLAPGVPGVLARATRGSDGKFRVFAVNKLPVMARLQVSVDGHKHGGTWKVDAFTSDDFKAKRTWGLFENPRVVSEGRGDAVLPPYSISVVTY